MLLSRLMVPVELLSVFLIFLLYVMLSKLL